MFKRFMTWFDNHILGFAELEAAQDRYEDTVRKVIRKDDAEIDLLKRRLSAWEDGSIIHDHNGRIAAIDRSACDSPLDMEQIALARRVLENKDAAYRYLEL
jgi:hypothetical protein